jgi:GH43 family beta-xylosidase
MEIKSKGQIFISQLEDSWTAKLVPTNITKP